MYALREGRQITEGLNSRVRSRESGACEYLGLELVNSGRQAKVRWKSA